MQFIYTENLAAGKSEKVTFIRWMPEGRGLSAMVKFEDGQVRGVPARLLLPTTPNPAVRQ